MLNRFTTFWDLLGGFCGSSSLSIQQEPLGSLTKKGSKWFWAKQQEIAYQSIRKLLEEHLSLYHFYPSLRTKV